MYVFTYAGWEGPCVERFDSAAALLGYVAGFTCGGTAKGKSVVVVMAECGREVRA